MKKKKEEKENPLHTEYGILSNSVYILGKIKKYCPKLLALMAVGVVTNSLMQYMWSIIGKFVLDIVEQQANSPEKDIAPLIKLLIITTAVEIVSMIINTVTDNKRWYNAIGVRMHVITERAEKTLSMNYQTLERPDILDMESKAEEATGGNNNGVEGLIHSVYSLGVQLFVMVTTFSVVAALDWRLVLIIAALSVVQFLFFRYTVKKDRKEVWDRLAPVWRRIHYMERTTQDFDYAKDVRLFGMKDWLSDKQHEILGEKQERMMRSRNLWIYNSLFAHGMTLISTAVVYGVLIYSFLGGGISIGDFTLYIGFATTFTSAMTGLLNSIGGYKQCSLQVDNFRSYMDLAPDDESDCIPVPESDKYIFEFKNVSFKYSGQENYALKNLNLTLEPGKRLAVVGLNGAGKTTFIKLLLRLYDVTEGEILLNGTDIRRFKRNEYYRLFSPVFQNVEIFAFPMNENVSMDRPEDTDKKRAEECLVKAGMAEKLASLEKGADTELLKVIYDDGVDLSGGEKQKLALARALYKDAPVIVLDEPTAALDALAEYNLYKSFDEIIGDKSAVYISHRLSSTRFCDSIAMFKAGEMVEYGTHDELLAKKGAYAEMFEIQAQYYKEGKDYAEAAE
ncbi:MAG: ABC transporter ATP-binding protein/permease [Oscillospiraceae bacterium]|nr:ABC transporter ATP-binding protein/permease [Oscillospiraceae bacterium]